MDKKIVYVFSDNCDYNNIVFENADAIAEWIKADAESQGVDDDLSDFEYTIRLKAMTREEYDNLPEAE